MFVSHHAEWHAWDMSVFVVVFLRETTNLENRILHDRGSCTRNWGSETGASPST